MHLFYCPDIKKNLYLDEQESFHAVKVLRLTEGDPIHLADGRGGFYEAILKRSNSKKCEFSIVNQQQDFHKRNYRVHIAIAPTKNADRNEWFLEKAIELGIDEISFIICEHSERKVINDERMLKTAIAAMKQSLKAYLPQINPIIPFYKFISNITEADRFVAHLEEGEKKNLFNVALPNKNYVVLIGPEGDFTSKEIQYAIENNFKPITLGKSRLRTETAGIAACHTLNLLNDSDE